MMMNYLREVRVALYFLPVINMDWFNIIKNELDDDNVYPYDYEVDALPYETDVMVRQNGGPPIAYPVHGKMKVQNLFGNIWDLKLKIKEYIKG